MTQAQFEKTLILWKECEKCSLSTAQMFHISEIVRSYVSPDEIIDAYRALVADGELPFTTGIPRKIALCSENISFGSIPETEAECIQQITVSATGNVSVLLKNFERKTMRSLRRKIPPEAAVVWLNNVNTHLSVYTQEFVTDVGGWSATITNDKSKTARFSGALIPDADAWLHRYSDELRELLEMPELYVFDGAVHSKICLCSCEFEYGGKSYYYQSNDPSIHVGDTVIVPVGKENTLKKARVVNVEFFDEDSLPMDPLRIKAILEKAETNPLYKRLKEASATGKTDLVGLLGKEPSVFDIVKVAIDNLDCEHLLEIGAPADEYDGESCQIAALLRPEYEITRIASTITEVMSHSFNTKYEVDSFFTAAAQIKEHLTLLHKLKGDRMRVVDMSSCFDFMVGQPVEITMKDGAAYSGILSAWIPAFDNEPDPESITITTPDGASSELFVENINEICRVSSNKAAAPSPETEAPLSFEKGSFLIRYVGPSFGAVSLTNGKVYRAVEEDGMYRVVDDSGEDYLYSKENPAPLDGSSPGGKWETVMTEKQVTMYDACNCFVKLQLVGKKEPLFGKCIGYTNPLDNEPEMASIDIIVPGFSSIYEILENEIESITVIDEKNRSADLIK